MVIDPENGNVIALVGARGEKKANLLLNYATSTRRPAGSSFKPISVYAPALENVLITYASVFDDAPINFGTERIDLETGKTVYSQPSGYQSNAPKGYNGLTNINEAIRVSKNTIACRVLLAFGAANSFDFLTNSVGISTLVESMVTSSGKVYSDIDIAPLALGQMTWGVTLKEMTSAYQIFANGGIYNKERIVLYILDPDGNVIVENEKESKIVLSAQNSSIMTKMLQNVVALGTGKSITLDKKKTGAVNCAGKTGTSQNDQDYWFIGYTPYYVCGVWFGYSMPRSLANSKFTASNTTLAAWDSIMTEITRKYVDADAAGTEKLKTFSLAPGVVAASFCKDSGMLMTDACKADPRGNRSETGYFVSGTEPTEYCTTHVLVDYCVEGKGIATDACRHAGATIKKYGLLNVSRSFPYDIVVKDAPYTMQVLTTNYSFEGLTASLPYYANLLKSGFYAGHSYNKNKTTVFNHVGLKHNDVSAAVPGE